jgi:sphinganine-1-phosphate aldolase
MSVDTHKFGYASKGTSVVLYRDKELRHAQYFCYSKWTGGMYATATIAGSRPGALLAATWAALVSIGESGYCERVQSIIKASEKIVAGISQIPGIYIMGEQMPTMVVCFASDEMDIYRVGDMMSKRGWHLNDLQHPPCMHICITLNVVPMVQQFLDDLSESVHAVRKEGTSGKKKGSAAMYGSVGGIPEGPVNQILEIYTDLTLTP